MYFGKQSSAEDPDTEIIFFKFLPVTTINYKMGNSILNKSIFIR